MRRHSRTRDRRAVALVIALSLLGVTNLLVIGAIASAGDDALIGRLRLDSIRAFYAAESGAAAALDRVVRVVREAPATAPGETTPDVVEATATSLEFAGGVRLELSGSTLLLTTATEAQSPLCQGVSALALEFLAADGVTDSSGAPTSTQRVNVRHTSGGVEARTSVFLRVGTGAGS